MLAVLDVVEVLPSGGRGVVTEVRRYPDGRFVYFVAVLDDDDAISGLYDEEDLAATGERAPLSAFELPGPLRVRDVVRIADDCDQPEIAGRTGVIDYAEPPDAG